MTNIMKNFQEEKILEIRVIIYNKKCKKFLSEVVNLLKQVFLIIKKPENAESVNNNNLNNNNSR
jgi:hypothetical protein